MVTSMKRKLNRLRLTKDQSLSLLVKGYPVWIGLPLGIESFVGIGAGLEGLTRVTLF